MRKNGKVWILTFLIVVWSWGIAWGDTVILKDGNIIRGKIIHEAGEVQIRTSYGLISVKSNEVEKILKGALEDDFLRTSSVHVILNISNTYTRIKRAERIKLVGSLIGVVGAVIEWIGIYRDNDGLLYVGGSMWMIGLGFYAAGEILLDWELDDLGETLKKWRGR